MGQAYQAGVRERGQRSTIHRAGSTAHRRYVRDGITYPSQGDQTPVGYAGIDSGFEYNPGTGYQPVVRTMPEDSSHRGRCSPLPQAST